MAADLLFNWPHILTEVQYSLFHKATWWVFLLIHCQPLGLPSWRTVRGAGVTTKEWPFSDPSDVKNECFTGQTGWHHCSTFVDFFWLLIAPSSLMTIHGFPRNLARIVLFDVRQQGTSLHVELSQSIRMQWRWFRHLWSILAENEDPFSPRPLQQKGLDHLRSDSTNSTSDPEVKLGYEKKSKSFCLKRHMA